MYCHRCNFQGRERFKKAVRENGGTVISGQASFFLVLNYHPFLGLFCFH
jgi:hypothetical protein